MNQQQTQLPLLVHVNYDIAVLDASFSTTVVEPDLATSFASNVTAGQPDGLDVVSFHVQIAPTAVSTAPAYQVSSAHP